MKNSCPLPKSLFFIALACCCGLVMMGCARKITETGLASFYGVGDGYNGRKTANGETFNTRKLTAAHKTIPFGTMVKVTNLSNSQTVKVRFNDRGPFVKGRIIDLSEKAAQKIDLKNKGVAQVSIRYRKK